MRISKQAAAENRGRILDAAARLFRELGIDGAGVDAITEDAGLTHGAFYSQFGSKEAVVAEALRLALEETCARWARCASGADERRALEAIIDDYLSPRHRDSPGKGCAVAALGSDLPRQPKRVREAFTKRLEENLATLAALVPAKAASRRRDVAMQILSTMVGALILARAVDDESLSRMILEAVARALKSVGRGATARWQRRAELEREQTKRERPSTAPVRTR
jgi:TetR/AcrR family transcriptional repressor of nem operon